MRPTVFWALGCVFAVAHPRLAQANDLVVNGTTVTLSGVKRYDHVCVINGGTVNVAPYAGGAKAATGNLELIAGSVYVDATSKIAARGDGYQPRLCSPGDGFSATAGGRGGCAVMDSGGGGAHFGRGGRGTVDNPLSTANVWQNGFPSAFEDDCMLSFNGTGCQGDTQPNGTPWPGANPNRSRTLCNTDGVDDVPGDPFTDVAGATVAGQQYWHNIYDAEFGSAGGDKGCRDGDGRSGAPMSGGGGGRLVLVGLSDRSPAPDDGLPPVQCPASGVPLGTVRIDGTIDANGKRGCGQGNDSGGGGGGGSVLIVGQNVIVGAAAKVSAAGGLGGDTNAAASPDAADCAAGVQAAGGTCDDCGGGGGGGIISVLSVTSDLQTGAEFNVNGAKGGVCTICSGEAGGGAGELQLDGAYVGEYCDGYDNDFDGQIDEDLGMKTCGLGTCAQPIAACSAGNPVACVPTVNPSDVSCQAAPNGARPRVAVILDTSGSMLNTLSGYPTFGDGSVERPGIDSPEDPDTIPNDSRLFLARESLAQVISAYPEIDFSLARYHQDQSVNRSCQTAKWFECQNLEASYDDPTNNWGTPTCAIDIGPATTINVGPEPNPMGMPDLKSQCINYAGSCGGPRRGADILSGFGSKTRDIVLWLDGRESNFSDDTTTGDYCHHSDGLHDCEVRGSGPTPLAGSLQAVEDYVAPIRQEDSAAMCRGYTVILVTDGAESCNGSPSTAAQHIYDTLGVEVYVVAVSVTPSEQASLNLIARSGSGNKRDAIFVTQPQQLVPALTSIISGAIRSESCNGADDDCDGRIDEDFPGLGIACDDHKKGICRGTGKIVCNSAKNGTECVIDTLGQTGDVEKCNSLDDDCDGAVDEGLDCEMIPCTHTGGEVCNGKDDDCDTKVDESDPAVGTACDNNVGECKPGTLRCVLGNLRCIGGVGPMMEQCNGKDDDCNGMIDDNAVCPGFSVCIDGACRSACIDSEFSGCPTGQLCLHSDKYKGEYCIPTPCALCKSSERCENNACVDPCATVKCADGLFCVRGACRDCTVAGCATGQVCYDQRCQQNLCASVTCDKNEFCFNGTCTPVCNDAQCPTGELCSGSGVCEADVCAGLSCEDGKVCRDGQCEIDPCRTMGCNAGNACVAEMGCIPDPCVVTVCGEGMLCSVGPHGDPHCTSPGVIAKPRAPVYISTAGSGLTSCSVSRVQGRTPPPSAALLLGLFGILLWRRNRGQRAHAVRAACCAGLVVLGGCKTSAICLDCLDPGQGGGVDASYPDSGGGLVPRADAAIAGDGSSGNGGSGGGSGNNGTCIKLGDEVCNKLDDDCDGTTDEGFDFMVNPRHCGGCDQACRSENADTSCQQGKCVTGSCLAGFADLDQKPGCEYRCPVFPAAAEDCNGADDDCDGRVDEQLVAPSANAMCRHTKGTPCENVKLVCATREKTTTWFCDYPSIVDFDPVVPDGIRLEEERCDGADNDCDGQADEPWPELGNPCDDGLVGACRDGGAMACASTQKTTFCDLSLPPDKLPGAGPDAVELCNNLDDNCDGIIDNSSPSDPKHVVDAMIAVPGHNYYIYTYEASRPDADGATPGIGTARSCSRAGAQPWTFVSNAAATAACAASGKRLCTANEWQWACEGSPATTYPYGANYGADICNGTDHDAVSGGARDNLAVASGSMAMCISAAGVYDLSGNVKEWTSDQQGTTGAPNNEPIYVVRGGSFESPRLGLTCQTALSQATANTVHAGLGFRCCSDTAP